MLFLIEPCQILLCEKRSYKLAFADPFAMLSRPHVLLSRALVSLELLSRRFGGGASQHAGFRGSFAAGLSLFTFAISFRKLSRPAFWLSRGFYRTPPFTTLYCQGFWRCSIVHASFLGPPSKYFSSLWVPCGLLPLRLQGWQEPLSGSKQSFSSWFTRFNDKQQAQEAQASLKGSRYTLGFVSCLVLGFIVWVFVLARKTWPSSFKSPSVRMCVSSSRPAMVVLL